MFSNCNDFPVVSILKKSGRAWRNIGIEINIYYSPPYSQQFFIVLSQEHDRLHSRLSLFRKYYLCPKWCKCIIIFVFELTFVVLSLFPVFLLHLRPRRFNKSPLCSNNLPGVILECLIFPKHISYASWGLIYCLGMYYMRDKLAWIKVITRDTTVDCLHAWLPFDLGPRCDKRQNVTCPAVLGFKLSVDGWYNFTVPICGGLNFPLDGWKPLRGCPLRALFCPGIAQLICHLLLSK